MPVTTNAGGGGGLDPDELTAEAGDILKGKLGGVKGSDEPVAGTLELTGDAADSHVMSGKSYYNTNAKQKRTGSMPNNGAQNASLNCGQSKTIPAGYTTGGTVTANSLASQTGGATADDTKVLSNYTYWKDGVKRTGNLAVQSVVNFNVAQYSNLTLLGTWAAPAKGPWSGLRVICKQGGYPANVNDGTLFYEGVGAWVTKSLAEGTWYFRAWNYINTSQGRVYGGYIDKQVWNGKIQGYQTYTSSTVFTVPAGVYSIDACVVGGGGGGGGGKLDGGKNWFGGGGGGGYVGNWYGISVTPGQQISIIIGAGGRKSGYDGNGSGGASAFGGYSVAGGRDGHNGDSGDGGSGGSGGGSADFSNHYGGGSDGGNGSGPYGGRGQGYTTRAFGGTLYAGGGGGVNDPGVISGGGAGGGGAGKSDGANGTGGGGGGANNYYCRGGSGCVVVRWGY